MEKNEENAVSNLKIMKVGLMMTLVMLGQVMIPLQAIGTNLTVGDEFSFHITSLSAEFKINGTEYEETSTLDHGKRDNDFMMREGTTIEVEITAIQDVESQETSTSASSESFQSSLLISSQRTVINYTLSADDNTRSGISHVDEWFSYFVIWIFVIAFSYGLASPEYSDFSPPEVSSITDDVVDVDDNNNEGSSSVIGLPFFVSDNESFYQHLVETFTEESNDGETNFTTTTSPFKTSESSFFETDFEDDQFSLDLSLNALKEQETKVGSWKYRLDAEFKISADLSRGIVTNFLMAFYLEETLEEATKIISFSFGFQEARRGLLDGLTTFSSLGVAFLVLLGTSVMLISKRKKILLS